MNEKLILTVIEKFNSGSIGELDLSDGTYRLTLRKEHTAAPAAAGAARQSTPQAAVQGEQSVRLGIPASANTAAEETGNLQGAAAGEKISSPIVATYYAAPGPDAPPFVKPGSRVKAGETLCILEAMKMMNHLDAEFNCEILETHAASGDLIEYGQTLFTVKRI